METLVDTQQLAEAFRASMRQDLNVNRTYHPVFSTAPVSDAAWAQFVLADPVIPSGRSYLEITSTKTKSFEEIQQRQSENIETGRNNHHFGANFLNLTVDRVYDFWKQNLRPADDSPGPYQTSAFTFVILDSACLASSPMQCVICSDAPDFNQCSNDLALKRMRVDIERAWALIVALEELTMTPTETAHWAANPQDDKFLVLEIVALPPTTVTLVEDENRRDIVRRYATPAEARLNKRKGIEAGDRQGWVPLQRFQGRFECAAYDL